MDKYVNGILFFIAVSSIYFVDFGWGLKFTVSPVVVSSIVPSDITLSCEVEAVRYVDSRAPITTKIGDLTAMRVVLIAPNADQLIASVHLNKSVATLESSVQAVGQVHESGRNSYLYVNITALQLDKTETLSCITYTTNNQELETASHKITVKDSRNVHFRALMQHKDSFKRFRTVYFRKLVFNEGNGYNIHTGKFKAPYAGYYLFLIGWHVQGNRWMFVDIKANSRVLTRIGGVAPTSWRNYAEGGVVAQLDKGDEVFPHVAEIRYSSVRVERRDSNGYINHFSGYMMKSV